MLSSVLHASRRFRASRAFATLAVLLASVATLAGAPPALADNVVVTPTTVTVAPDSGTTPLTGTSIGGYTNGAQPLFVSLSTTLGTLSITQTSGLTLSYGYSSFSGASFSFVGTQANVQAALATLSLTGSGTTGTAAVSVAVTANQTGLTYLPATGHFYEYIATPGLTWATAQADAAALTFDGQSGYLATIPNATVNAFTQNQINGAHDVWAGAASIDYPAGYLGNAGIQRVWTWQYGPLAGTIFTECSNVATACVLTNDSGRYHNWNGGEPNNSGYPSSGDPGEHYLEINPGGSGHWNDFANGNAATSGYLVEFGDLAYGGNFTGFYSATANVALATAPDAPTAVTATGASNAGANATVSWTAPTNTGGAPITGYTVTAAPGGASCTSATTSCTVAGLTNGSPYTFTVTATNPEGTSVPSAASSATTVSGAPAAPASVSVTPGDGQATVSWTAPANNASPITGYVVTASPGGATCTTTTTTCTLSGLTDGVAYTFTLTATNAVGTSVAASSPAPVAPVAPTVPAPVSVPLVSRRVISIHWIVPAGMRTGSYSVLLNGRPINTLGASARAVSVSLVGMPGPATVRITVRTRSRGGGLLSTTRVLHICVTTPRKPGHRPSLPLSG